MSLDEIFGHEIFQFGSCFVFRVSDFFIFLKGSDCLHAGIATHACKDIKIVKDELFSASNAKGNFQFHENLINYFS